MKKVVVAIVLTAVAVSCSKGDKRKFGLVEKEKESVKVETQVDSKDNDKELAECRAELGTARAQAEKITLELKDSISALKTNEASFDKYKGVYNDSVIASAKKSAEDLLTQKITSEIMRLTPVSVDQKFKEELFVSAADEIRDALSTDPSILSDLFEDVITGYHASSLKSEVIELYKKNAELEATMQALYGTELRTAIATELNAYVTKVTAAAKNSENSPEMIQKLAEDEFFISFDRLNSGGKFADWLSRLHSNLDSVDTAEVETAAIAFSVELGKIGRKSRAFDLGKTKFDGVIDSIVVASYSNTISNWIKK